MSHTCCIETGTLIYYNVLKLSLIVFFFVFWVGVPIPLYSLQFNFDY